jgi:hypothetical protein
LEFDMTNATGCAVIDCDRPVKRRGYCYGHYMKAWRYGTPTPIFDPAWQDIRGQRFGTLVVSERIGRQWLCACDCGRDRLASAGELNRTGEAATCGDRRTHRRLDEAGYTAAHERCRSDRGPVQTHTCVDCGGPAQHWSYDHDDPDERLAHGLSANPVAYSLNPEHYSPRCVSCHKRFDLGRLDAAHVR